jgi:hypothetical protein
MFGQDTRWEGAVERIEALPWVGADSLQISGFTSGLPGAAEAIADVYKSESPAWGERGFLMGEAEGGDRAHE